MPFKDPKRRKIYQHGYGLKWYKKNREKVIVRIKTNKHYRYDWFREYKTKLRCRDCGMSFKKYPEVCDFHHIDQNDKKYSLNKISRNGSRETIMKEVQKCVPLCSNCHRIRHVKEKEKK